MAANLRHIIVGHCADTEHWVALPGNKNAAYLSDIVAFFLVAGARNRRELTLPAISICADKPCSQAQTCAFHDPWVF